MADYAVVKETTLAWGGVMDGTPYWTTYVDNSSVGQFMGNRLNLAQSDCVFLVGGCGISLTAIIGSVREAAHGRNNGGSTMSLAGGILTDGSLSVTASSGTLNTSTSSYDAADNSLQWNDNPGAVNNGTSDNFYSGSPLSLTGSV